MRSEAQIARFWLLRRRVSQSLRAHSQIRKHALIYGFWSNAHDQYTNPLAKTLADRLESCENIVWISFKRNVWEVAFPPPPGSSKWKFIDFMFLLVDYGKVLCCSVDKLQQNSNTSSKEEYIPRISTVL